MKKLLALLLCMAIAIPLAAQLSEKPLPEAIAPAARTSNQGYLMASLPAGTAVKMKLDTMISTRTSRSGQRFAGRVTEGVRLNGRTIIPVGASLEGRIARVQDRRRIRGTPTIDLRPDTIIMPSGDRYTISLVAVDTSARPDVDVNDEGKLKGRGHDNSDWRETGIVAAGGAIAGGVIAGGEGALIGAGVGATATMVHWLMRTRSATLPAGTEIVWELSRPMSLGAGDGGQ
jgi:hypothetical protein